ncbi:MAG TPA: carboxylesterase family protein, partial [Vicinamibacteria bacterium]|nr:carboxylesterase family protein [Vicinamibacteria bacterium]
MRRVRLLAAAVFLLAARVWAEPARVTVESGVLSGVSDGAVQAFKGIPYARPPVGALRWRPPQRAESWRDPREATAFGPVCPQSGTMDNVDGGAAAASEDCLSLNVWAPARPSRPAPVMVWLHGGGNQNGAGSKRYYDGAAFARDGVVLVTINYRLGLLGFFAHPALTREAAPGDPLGNYGLMDQVAALAWVRKNIQAFGGDPRNVTLFGESAGGQDIVALLTAPAASGLFDKAIVESAGFWVNLPSLAEAEASGVRTASALAATGAVTADRLRAVPAEDVAKIDPDRETLIVDGRFLPQKIQQAFASGKAARVPLVIGTNSDEGSLVGGGRPAELLADFKPEELAKVRAAYGEGRDDTSLARLLFRDLYFTAPARWIARRASAEAPTFFYRFSYVRRSQ